MKKLIIAAAALVAMLSFTSCGETGTSEKTSEKAPEVTIASDTAEEEQATQAAANEETVTEEETTEAVTEMPVPTELSTKYADLDNRSFKYNGKLFVLGVSTLQDVLDEGAELVETLDCHEGLDFDKKWDHDFEGDLFNDTLKYKIKDTSVMMKFAKLTSEPIAMRDCVLVDISGRDDFPDEFEFSFDKSLTVEELLSNSGEQTSFGDDSYAKRYYYEVDSEKYPNHRSGYEFTFYYDGKLISVWITWLP
jgi:hypothetical protein